MSSEPLPLPRRSRMAGELPGTPLAGLILVLFRPQPSDLERWLEAGAGLPLGVAVDNSETVDIRLHARLRRAGIEVLVNHNRGGLAGAYNRGAEWLLARGCELIFLFDQDSRLRTGFFERMLAAAAGLAGQPFILGPVIYERRLQRYMPVLDPAPGWPRPVPMDGKGKELVPSLCVISSGSAISAAAWHRLGGFREDYFIEYLDVEYALRAWHRGVPVYTHAAAVLEQQAGDIVRHGRHYSTRHPAWRRYYMARNAMHALRLYPGRSGLLFGGLCLLLYQACGVLRFERARRHKLAAMLIGLVDGLRGRMGRLEDRHARRWRSWRAG